MKWNYVILMALIVNNLNAQTTKQFSKQAFIDPYILEVTLNKTTNLIFPSPVVTVDRGSQDIVVQKTAGAENILKVKAASKRFAETNLSVITTDGKLYSFVIDYADDPCYLNIDVADAFLKPLNRVSSDELVRYANRAAQASSNMGMYSKNSGICFALKGLYVHDSTIYLRLLIRNHTRINYDVDQLRFYIRDKKQSKRTALQELEIQPVYISDYSTSITTNETETPVIAIPKFTIPDGKLLEIELAEKNGGRNLMLTVKNKHVMRARVL